MQLYANPNRQDHIDNCAAFENFMARYDWAKFFRPQPEKAPWHVQCIIEGQGDTIFINFWPHKAKAQRDKHKPVEGWNAIRSMMAVAIDDSQEDPISLIED